MYYVIVGIVCLIVGAVGAVIYYRRNVAKVEAALADAKARRDAAEKLVEELKTRLDRK